MYVYLTMSEEAPNYSSVVERFACVSAAAASGDRRANADGPLPGRPSIYVL